jgi:four helix bundle protein
MNLVVAAYSVAKRLPKEEKYELGSQIRRAAASVPANVAEGHGREQLGDYLRHLSIANGSLMELETEILVAERIGYVSSKEIETMMRLAADVGRMLTGLTKSLQKRFRARENRKPGTGHRTP